MPIETQKRGKPWAKLVVPSSGSTIQRIRACSSSFPWPSSATIAEIDATAGEASGGIDLEAIRIEDSDELKVLCPATAIFYTTPTPTEPEYVTVGDKIRVTDTVGQLEAMKIFTPLKLADFNTEATLYDPDQEFEVTRINMATGQQVNVGDLLFVVKPLG